MSNPLRGKRSSRFDGSLVACMVLLTVMISPVLVGRIYTLNDLGDYHLPLRAFYSEQLARGESFLWTPQLFCGYYVAGEGQVGMFHPWHLAIYRALPVWLALAVEAVGSYPLMFAGTWLFLRRRLSRREAATFGAMVFTFGSFNLLHFIHVNAIAVVAHLPWLLWAMDVLLGDADHRRARAAQMGVALLTGSQILLGYPQYVWFSLLAEVGYLLWLVVERRTDSAHADSATGQSEPGRAAPNAEPGHAAPDAEPGHAAPDAESGRAAPDAGRHGPARSIAVDGELRRRCLAWTFAKIVGLLLGGIQLLPTMDVLGDSVRQSVSAWYRSYGSLHPWNLVQLVAPYLFNTRVYGRNTYELGIYLGAVPLMLVLWSLVQHRHLGRLKRFHWAVAGFGMLALWLALGKYGHLYGLQQYVPIVGGFRCPCRYAVLFQLSMAIMAAIGFWLLLGQQERGEKTPWSALRLLGIPVVLSLATLLAPWIFPSWPYFSSREASAFSPVLMATAAVLVVGAARGSRAALVALVFFTAADLGFYGFKHCVLRDTQNIYTFIKAIPVPQNRPDGRVLMNPENVGERGVHYGNAILLTGWSRADGYTGLEARRRLDYRQLAALRAAGVRWVMRNELTVNLQGLVPQGDWLEVPDPLPRAHLVTDARTSSDPARDLATTPIETAALVESPLDLPAGPAGLATLYDDRPGRLEVWVDCRTPQLLVVAERYHPGWQAHVEGKPREVLRVNGDFQGCLVRPGEHRVLLTFQPRSLRQGMIVTGIGLVLLGGLSLVVSGQWVRIWWTAPFEQG